MMLATETSMDLKCVVFRVRLKASFKYRILADDQKPWTVFTRLVVEELPRVERPQQKSRVEGALPAHKLPALRFIADLLSL